MSLVKVEDKQEKRNKDLGIGAAAGTSAAFARDFGNKMTVGKNPGLAGKALKHGAIPLAGCSAYKIYKGFSD